MVKFPQDTKDGAVASGHCSNGTSEQNITVSWGAPNASSSFTMAFNMAAKNEWTITSFTADLFMNKSVFIDGKDAGEFILIETKGI